MLPSEVQLDVGGSLRFQPTQQGRPSAAACALYSPEGASLGAATVTVDPVDTTLTAEAAESDESLELTTTTGVQARAHYVVELDDGQRVVVRVRATRGTTVDLFAPLDRAITDGARFYSTRMTAPVAAGVATPTAEGYEARWTYTTDGVVQRAVSRWSVVRSPWPTSLGTVEGLATYAGHLLSPLRETSSQRGLRFADELEHATSQLRRDLIDKGRRPGLFRSFASFEEPVYERLLFDLAETGAVVPSIYSNNPSEYVAIRRERYTRMLLQAMSATEDYDADGDGVVTKDEAKTTARTFRFSR